MMQAGHIDSLGQGRHPPRQTRMLSGFNAWTNKNIVWGWDQQPNHISILQKTFFVISYPILSYHILSYHLHYIYKDHIYHTVIQVIQVPWKEPIIYIIDHICHICHTVIQVIHVIQVIQLTQIQQVIQQVIKLGHPIRIYPIG